MRFPSAQDVAFLVVDDDEPSARTVARLLRPLGKVTVAHTLREALAEVDARTSWTALFVDWHLSSGESGLDVVAACRARDTNVPILVLTGASPEPIVNRVFNLGAELALKAGHEGAASLQSWATRAVARQAARAARVKAVADAWTWQYAFTSAEAMVFRGALHGASREELARQLGVAPDTIKKYAHRIVQKSGDGNLDAALVRALREIVTGPVDLSPQGDNRA